MFTGIITDVGEIVSIAESQHLRRLRIRSSYRAESIALGASIACAGACMTVVACEARSEGGCWFEVDAAAETLALTTVRHWTRGDRINLERSLRVGDELGGHIVTGHVDGIATITQRSVLLGEGGDSIHFTLQAPHALRSFIAAKGSVTLDGVSFTVNDVRDGCLFILIIPHTLDATTWRERNVGDAINLEIDLLARYAHTGDWAGVREAYEHMVYTVRQNSA